MPSLKPDKSRERATDERQREGTANPLDEEKREIKKRVVRWADSSKREIKLAMGKSTSSEKESTKLKNIDKKHLEATASLAGTEDKIATTSLQTTHEELMEKNCLGICCTTMSTYRTKHTSPRSLSSNRSWQRISSAPRRGWLR